MKLPKISKRFDPIDVSEFSLKERIEAGLSHPGSIVEVTTDKGVLEAIEYVKSKRIAAFDTETTSLVFHEAEIILVQMGDAERQYLIWYGMIDPQPITDYLNDPEYVKAGLNLKYDARVWATVHGLKARMRNIADTQLVEQIIGCGLMGEPGQTLKMTGMEAMVRRWFGLAIPKDDEIRVGWTHDMNPIAFEKKIRLLRKEGFPAQEIASLEENRQARMMYAADDVIWPLRLLAVQKPWVKELGLAETVNLEMRFLPVLVEQEVRGMKVDVEKWTGLATEAYNKLQQAQRDLDKIFGVDVQVEIDEKGVATYKRAIKYGSSHELKDVIRKYMWDNYGIEVIMKNRHFYEALKRYGKFNPDRLDKLFTPRKEPNPKKKGKMMQVAYPNGTDVVKEWYEEFKKFLPRDAFACTETTSPWFKILKVINQTPTKEVDAKHATKIGLPPELVDPILALRKYGKVTSTYGLSFLNKLYKGRVHTSFLQAALTTLRTSSSPNVQNFPAKADYRACFIVDEGYKFVGADWSQIEPRIQAELSQEPIYMRVFWSEFPDSDGFARWCGSDVKEVLDLYTEVGKTLGIIPIGYTVADTKGDNAKKDGLKGRKQAKIVVLGLSYGTGQWKFYLTLIKDTGEHQTWDVSSKLFWGFWKNVPALKACMDELSRLASPEDSDRKVTHPFRDRPVTYSEAIGGAKRFFDEKAKSAWTEGRNHPIQGTGARVMKHASVVFQEWCWEQEFDVGLVNNIHDEFLALCEEAYAEVAKTKMKAVMEQVGEYYCKTVPITADAYIDDKWKKD